MSGTFIPFISFFSSAIFLNLIRPRTAGRPARRRITQSAYTSRHLAANINHPSKHTIPNVHCHFAPCGAPRRGRLPGTGHCARTTLDLPSTTYTLVAGSLASLSTSQHTDARHKISTIHAYVRMQPARPERLVRAPGARAPAALRSCVRILLAPCKDLESSEEGL